MVDNCKIITIDGPSGAGKGTISKLVASHFSFHYLDSGLLYRVMGYLLETGDIQLSSLPNDNEWLGNIRLEDTGEKIFFCDKDISQNIRSEASGNRASKIAEVFEAREALLAWQRKLAISPGLVADGRDMGTVVFPEASLKVFLTASIKERAQRRHKQLIKKGISSSISGLEKEISERDLRDKHRIVSPLVPAHDAFLLDSTDLSIEQVALRVINEAQKKIAD
tara:strand:- start:1200 stop:1868 length:669 start_codon:yes stop_codon:yes gene_type:complete